MNCKPGDLAVLVRATSTTEENIGRLFEVLSAEPPRTYIQAFGISEEMPAWLCRSIGAPCKGWSGKVKQEWVIPDFALRPIRPGDIRAEDVRELYDAPKLGEVA